MSPTWKTTATPPEWRIGLGGWARILLRAGAIISVILLGLVLLGLLVAGERLLRRKNRPISAWVTVFVCRTALRLLGLSIARQGRPMRGAGAMVANHASWLDIFVLNSGTALTFVSKAEVAGWPGIGLLARVTGTLFISRTRSRAAEQTAALNARLQAGERLLFFPEGTSTDGQRILPFKAPLFEAFFDPALPEDLKVQPVSVRYHAPPARDPRVYGWWGDMGFAPHLLATLALHPQGKVSVIYHAPISVAQSTDRKALANAAETAVRSGFATTEDASSLGGAHKGQARGL